MTHLRTVITRSYEAIERADWSKLDELFTSDCTMVDPASTCANLAEMKQAFRAYDQAFSELQFEIDHLVEGQDTVVVESTIKGVHTGTLPTPDGQLPPSGRRFAVRACEVARFRDGLIVSSHIYYDQVDFLSQLGVLDAVPST